MSFHNRLLFNRVVVNRLATVQVMLAVRAATMPQVMARLPSLSARVLRADQRLGYLRVDVPTERFLDLVAHHDIEAYQISSLSLGAWYRDGPPRRNAEMFRGFEVSPPRTPQPSSAGSSLPVLDAARAIEAGFTAGEDVGVAAWMGAHPTADGRGVTIAILESGLADFTHSTTRLARSLDGREVKKIVGIVNEVDLAIPDSTRVELSEVVQAATRWVRVGPRTYILPRVGNYRFGIFALPAGANLTHQFGVIEDERSGEIWVDGNGNADFSDEPSVNDINDVNLPTDARQLTLSQPAGTHISFVVARGRFPHTIHVYTATGSHQAMTLSVAAGSRSADSPAAGVAPGARVLLVRRSGLGGRLDEYIEGYIDAAQRPDVDVLCDSSGVDTLPNGEGSFFGVMFDRIIATYGKPIFRSGGNLGLRLESVTTFGGTFSVGGTLGPRTFEALYGGASFPTLILHPLGAAGPALDGTIKPDFLAPMHVVAADIPGGSPQAMIPLSQPRAKLPPGYQISCCTSASSPYAAGVAALLISRAKQEGASYSLPHLARALRLGARFLPGTPVHEQGNGALDIEAAWNALTKPVEVPAIVSSAGVVTPFAMYSPAGGVGSAIYERDGWFVGRRATRPLTLRRDTGARQPVVYRVSWTGNDGTFDAPASIALPLNSPVTLPVSIAPATPGAHSAFLNLHDVSTDAIVFRSQATIVAAERLNARDHPLVLAGIVPLMQRRAHYLAIPDGVGALSVELKVIRGLLNTTILRNHGLSSGYYDTVNPAAPRTFGPGTYSVTIERPEPGTWTLAVANTTAVRDTSETPAWTSDAEYSIAVRFLGAALTARLTGNDRLTVGVTSTSRLQAPALDVSMGILKSHHATFLPTGFPNEFVVDIPANATALTLASRLDQQDGLHELYLYDCTTGQCFSHSFTVPAARSQLIVVDKPRAGRWLAAVNPAPFASATGGVTLDELITIGETRRLTTPSLPRRPGDKWSYEVALAEVGARPAEGVPVVRLELVDLASADEARAHPWETKPASSPEAATVGSAIYVRQ